MRPGVAEKKAPPLRLLPGILRRRPLLILGVPIAVLILADLARRDDPPQPVGNAVEIDPDRLDFGTVWSTDDFVWEAPIRNISGGTLDVELVTSCGCTLVEPDSFSLRPGEELTLTFHLDLHYDLLPTDETPERGFAATIYAHSAATSADPRRDMFKLGGRVRDAIRPPTHVKFAGADRLLEGRPAPPCTLTMSAITPLAELRGESVSPDFDVDVRRHPDAGDQWLLTVAPTDLVPLGEFAGELRLHPIPASGEPLPSVPIRIEGTREPDISVVPARLQFVMPVREDAEPETGDASPQSITVWSRSGRSFLVEGVAAEGLVVEPPASDTADRHEFTVHPTGAIGAGDTQLQLTFSVYVDGESRNLVLPVSIHGSTAGSRQRLAAK